MKLRDLKCFEQVASVIGPELAEYELQRVIDSGINVRLEGELLRSFDFAASPQEYDFWKHVNYGENPYGYGHDKPKAKEWVYHKWAGQYQWSEYYEDGFFKQNNDFLPVIEEKAFYKSIAKPDWEPILSEKPHVNSDKNAVPESESGDKERSDGSTASYYELPEKATELQHLISHRNMNSQIGEIFRACYRYGLVSHSDMLRDAKKIRFYAQAEIDRLGNGSDK